VSLYVAAFAVHISCTQSFLGRKIAEHFQQAVEFGKGMRKQCRYQTGEHHLMAAPINEIKEACQMFFFSKIRLAFPFAFDSSHK
jgi:tRNA U55 pseudouridine synthase TruB